jgi:hypothetical protein
MEFLDETGKVKATAFNQEVEKFFGLVVIGNVNKPFFYKIFIVARRKIIFILDLLDFKRYN